MKHILLKIYIKPIQLISDILYVISSKLQNHIENIWWKENLK